MSNETDRECPKCGAALRIERSVLSVDPATLTVSRVFRLRCANPRCENGKSGEIVREVTRTVN